MSRRLRMTVLLALGVVLGVTGLHDHAAPATPRALPPNTWVNLQAEGVALGRGVGDEAYNTFTYSPGLGKGLVFASYHAYDVASGEDQNALLAYDFAQNRWDILEITEAAWSEFLPGVGHDQGNAAVDTINDLYIIRGNMTLHGNTAFQTYAFDLKAGRGKRMMPPSEPSAAVEAMTAYSPDHRIMLTTLGPSWLYDPQGNVWTSVPNSPSQREGPSLTYDSKHHLFVMFGGEFRDETWIFDPASRTWSKRSPAVSPPGRKAGNMAFDSDNGVVLLVGGLTKGGAGLADVWVYDAGANTWTHLPVTAPKGTNMWAGNNLIYDTHHKVFLLKDSVNLRNVWAFRYAPAPPGAPRSSAPREPLPPGVRLVAEDTTDRPLLDLTPRTWIARHRR